MHLHDIFSGHDLHEMITAGYVRAQTHPHQPLAILNYTEKAQFDRVWNDVTLNTRGLIYNTTTGEVVARPWRKFFNWDESFVGKIPIGPMIKAPKMDGSLGILYYQPEMRGNLMVTHHIASRGSFTSEQATAGTRLFIVTSMQKGFRPLEGCTYLFEIIYPENRIVVDYGDFQGLVLLDVLDTETGLPDLEAFDAAAWPYKAEKTAVPTFDAASLTQDIKDDEEGFVLYWPFHDLRVKMKGAEYVRLHRIVTGIDSVKVWEYLRTGKTIDDILSGAKVPDEFFDWLKKTADYLTRMHHEVSEVARIEFEHIYDATRRRISDEHPEFRKEFALRASKVKYSSLLFAQLDGRDITDAIWKICKPARVAPFDRGENC